MNSSYPFWVRRLVNVLRSLSFVDYARLRSNRIIVDYSTGLRRTYTFRPHKRYYYSIELDRASGTSSWPIKIGYEHSWNPLDPQNIAMMRQYFHIPRKVVDSASIIDRELLIQFIISELLGKQPRPYITDEMVDNDLYRIKTYSKVYNKTILDLHADRSCKIGRSIVWRYYDIFDMSCGNDKHTLSAVFSSPKALYSALQDMINNTKMDINISNIYRILYKRRYGPRWYNPAIFRVLIESTYKKQPRTIIDATPHLFEKALTAWALGCSYATIDGSSPPEQLIARIGLAITQPLPPYDLLIYDNNFKPVDIKTVVQLRSQCDRMLVYVPQSQVKALVSAMRPNRTVKIKPTAVWRADSQMGNLLMYGL